MKNGHRGRRVQGLGAAAGDSAGGADEGEGAGDGEEEEEGEGEATADLATVAFGFGVWVNGHGGFNRGVRDDGDEGRGSRGCYDRWFGFRRGRIGEDDVEGTRGRVGVADEGEGLEGLGLGAAQQEADGLADVGLVAGVNDEQEASVWLDGYWVGVVVADTGEDLPTNESGGV